MFSANIDVPIRICYCTYILFFFFIVSINQKAAAPRAVFSKQAGTRQIINTGAIILQLYHKKRLVCREG